MLWIIAFCAAGAVALTAIWAHRASTASGRLVRSRILDSGGDMGFAAPSVLRDERKSRMPFADKLPMSPEAQAKAAAQLELAGLPWRPNEYLAMKTGAALLFAVSGGFFSVVMSMPGWALIVAVLLGTTVGWRLPGVRVSMARNRRAKLVESQIPEALTAIAKSLRAGSGLLQGLAHAADETAAPLGPELRSALRDLELGAEAEVVFGTLSRRVGSADLDIALTAIMIQRTVGGNLSEILTTVAETIRERFALRREIEVLTSRQRLTSNLVAAIPVLVAAVFLLVNRDLGKLLFTTTAGQIALGVGIGFELMGIFAVRRLAVIEV